MYNSIFPPSLSLSLSQQSLDSVTRHMSVDEYKEFSEMRQANFREQLRHNLSFYAYVYIHVDRNMLRFKEWLNLPAILPATQSVNQNMFSVLGYLAYDIVVEVS